VIDAEDATLVEDLVNLLSARCARESWAERLLDDDPAIFRARTLGDPVHDHGNADGGVAA